MVSCSICSKLIIGKQNINPIGQTRIRIGLGAYLLNDAFSFNKSNYRANESFQVFCEDCFEAGHYHKRIIQKYPDAFSKYFQAVQKKKFNEYEKTIAELRQQLVAADQRLLKAHMDGLQQISFSQIYAKFEKLYHFDQKKMKSLQSFKAFAKEISTKDLEFKKKMQQFSFQIQKDYINISMVRIQELFLRYIKQIDTKFRCCEQDIARVKELQAQVVGKCSQQRSSLRQDSLINAGRMKTITNLFQNEIKSYEKTLAELKKIKTDGIFELNEEQLEISKIDRQHYHMSDAQMHEKKESKWKFRQAYQ